jgi:hypothetical protein
MEASSQLHNLAALPMLKEQPVPTEQELGGPHSGSGLFQKKRKHLAPARIEPWAILLTA